MPRVHADVRRAVDRSVLVHDAFASNRDAHVVHHRAGRIHGEAQLHDARLQRLQIGRDLLRFGRVELRRVGDVIRVRLDRLAVALELHRAKSEVAEDLVRR
jgi:hypothetical protein